MSRKRKTERPPSQRYVRLKEMFDGARKVLGQPPYIIPGTQGEIFFPEDLEQPQPVTFESTERKKKKQYWWLDDD